jgi:anti-sigma regulatory factor (Ser/Thr protein kinase)
VLATTRDEKSIKFMLASDISLVHPIVQISEQFVQECGCNDESKVSLVLRELLTNAIAHGNRNVLARNVNCSVDQVDDGSFRVVVEDEGEGFDFQSLDTTIPDDPRAMHRRGYVLVRNVCSQVEFNDCGNCITAYVSNA